MIKIGEHLLEIDDNCHESTIKFSASLADITLRPDTMCGLTWADHRRLFMCKLRAISDHHQLGIVTR
jgi:hypothetical protein